VARYLHTFGERVHFVYFEEFIGDVRREVTVLGPWESAPEHGVYSNESEVAKALIGHGVGDIVTFMGNDYQIEAIRRWND